MPAAVLKSLADKSGKSISDLERYWNEAKKAAEEKGLAKDSPNYYAYAVAIVKKRAGIGESLEEFCDWILDVAIDEYLEEEGETQTPGAADAASQAGDAADAAANLPPLGQLPVPPGEPGAQDPENLPPQNIKGETMLQQYARKKGKTEYEIEQTWNKVKDKARVWQASEKATDKEMLEYAVKIFQQVMEIMPDAPPPEEVAQQAAIVQAKVGNLGSMLGGPNAEATNGEEDKENGEKGAEGGKPPFGKGSTDKKKDGDEKVPAKDDGEKKKKKEESKAKTEAAIAKAESNLREAYGIKATRNSLSSKEIKALKGVGLKGKDLEALNDKQIKTLLKKIEKRNKAAQKNIEAGKGFGFMGNTIMTLGAFAGGFAAGKALDAAFKKIFSTGKKSINPNFGGGDF